MTEKLVRPAITRLKPYIPGKPIEEVKRELGLDDVIKLASNENPLGPSPRAVQAMRKCLKDVRLYPDNECYHLKRKLAQRLGFPPEQVLVGRGSDEIIHMIGLAFLEKGDEVLIPSHPFVLYEFTGTLMDAELVRVPLREYRYDLEAMAERIGPRTKLAFIGNPNNPTGTIITHDELVRFLDRLGDQGIVVLDEAYYEYAEDAAYPRSLELVKEGRNVIVLRTFSKIYALAGLRIGYGVARPELAAALAKVREPFNVSTVAQAAALASLEDGFQVERSLKINRRGKKYLYRELKRLKLKYVPTEANFIFVDCGRDALEVARELLRRGVIVRADPAFGYPTHFRVTVGKPAQNRRFIAALKEVLA
ncbi:MAG: histidinol-phosphate transaminase [Armatimonadetes bacterium]|nr:histidinol-phosphate transaminase [Armatimonadota bacterium]NIM24470.1 histidinol-phosphate transaminase [Armatimonadota bacterium]NIM68341.1 histidinol-phosphate transaminase [Armatimonadota bacterium]NIM76745.1 histidinol-phosphate transaminase [Armatimonadota bacterium]NIN06544.1 histidinol-phosphate transaminase [Armatimonadota bacterium]